jgi:hypothetical protein
VTDQPAISPSTTDSERLLVMLAAALDRMAYGMCSYVLKRESLHGELLTDDERTALPWAIALLAGPRQLARLWRDDDRLR